MKRFSIFLTATIVLICIVLRSQMGAQQAGQSSFQSPTPYSIVTNEANSRVWERTSYEQGANGQSISKIHRYTEMATGLNHLVNGQLVESKEEIDILPDGSGAATNGQHQAYFPGDIYQGEIEVVTPDGLQLQSRPIGVSYDDGSNTVMFAILTNSVGQLLNSNQVIYPNAFEGLNADLLYTYRKSGFEQDVVIRQQLPAPESYGMDPQITHLQLLTEFFNTADPAQTTARVSRQDGLTDTTLTFGKMKMARGKAFSIGNAASSARQNRSIPVYKSWTHLQGRTFLVEELPYWKVELQAAQLPPGVNNTTTSEANQVLHKVSTRRLLPPIHLVQASTKAVQLAAANPAPKGGVVLDYDEIDTDQTNYTFQGDTTYYISGYDNIDGTTVFEGGTVLKFDSTDTAGLICNGNVICQTGPYLPAIFTDMNDDSVGQQISGSTGTPQEGFEYLTLNTTVDPLKYLRMLYSDPFIVYCADPLLKISDSQFFFANDNNALDFNNDETLVRLDNDLFGQCGAISYNDDTGDGGYVYGNHLTADQLTYGISLGGEGCVGYLTNSLLTALGDTNGLNLYSSELVASDSGIYQTIGGGSYYLATNSPYHNAGTTNIDPAVLADIATKTTYPPIVYSNVSISTPSTLSLQATRDNTGNPDLGYHYDPLDYAFGGCTLSTNLNAIAGTAIGLFGVSGQSAGILLNNGANVTATGTATAPCWIAFGNEVQETCNGLWLYSERPIAFQLNGSGAGEPQINTTFVKMYDGAFGNALVSDSHARGTCNFQNSEFWMGGFAPYDEQSLIFSNCFFFRPQLYFWDQSDNPNLTFENCTFFDGILIYGRQTYFSSSVVTVENSAFDGTAFPWADNLNSNTNDTIIDYNSYNTNNLSWQSYYYPYGPCYGTLQTVGSHTQYVPTYDWESSWFGDYYLPANSPLINAGSTTADRVGLYHFTVQTNQIPETNSTVDVGYHYVATDQSGNPLDTNGDGIPDYLEDANGDGIFDAGDLGDWQISPYGLSTGSGLQVFTPLK